MQVAQIGLQPGYGWGFFLEGSYHFGHGKDFNLNYYHYDSGFTKTNALAANGSITSTLLPRWDAINFEFGQLIHLNESSDLRLHGGVEYARVGLKSSFTSVVNVANTLANLTTLGTLSGQTSSFYSGFGPRVGADLAYQIPGNWVNNLSIYGNAAVGLLAGAAKSSTMLPRLGSIDSTANIVVPEIDLKLGVNYAKDLFHGQLNFDAGWMWADYISAIYQTATTKGDVAFQGLFFGMKWQGNFA